MGGYSGGQGNSLQNSSAASAEAESSTENTVSTGGKTFNIVNKGSGMSPWMWVGLALIAAATAAYVFRR